MWVFTSEGKIVNLDHVSQIMIALEDAGTETAKIAMRARIDEQTNPIMVSISLQNTAEERARETIGLNLEKIITSLKNNSTVCDLSQQGDQKDEW